MRKGLLYLTAIVLFMVACADTTLRDVPGMQGVYDQPPKIRVCLLNDAGPERVIDLQTRGAYRIYIPGRQGFLFEGSDMPPGRIRVSDGGVQVGDKTLGKGRIVVLSQDKGMVGINNRFYRGSVSIEPHEKDRFTLINEVDIESYLYGVIPCEMPADWPYESLKAQAVASRSFALWRIKTRADQPYDVTADIYSQVYQGVEKETEASNRAVAATRGIVMLYQKKVFPAYFHSSSGGHTADAYAVWGQYKIPPLAGRSDPYSNFTPGYSWRQHFTKAYIVEALRKAKPPITLPGLVDIEPVQVAPSGRASRVRLIHDKGFKEITADALRKYLGKDKHGFLALRSTKFNVIRKGDSFWFFGKGNGHGIGMSQWGAREMAKSGSDARDILAFYYPQSELWRLY